MIRYLLLITILGTAYSCTHHPTLDSPWDDILVSEHPVFNNVLDSLDQYEVQIIYTEIEKKNDSVEFKSHQLNVDENQYFYPASTVKMPVAFLAIEYINELAQENPDIDIYTRLSFDSIAPPQTPEHLDTTSITGYPNVAHYIEQIFSVSDNNAYNRLYELMGQDYINEKLREKGVFQNSKIIHRVGVSGFDTEANKYTNPYKLISDTGSILYEQDELYALYENYPTAERTLKGLGYYDDALEKVVQKPFDFSQKNFISLRELQESLIRVKFPDVFPYHYQYNHTEEQRRFLYETLYKTPDQYEYLEGHDEYYDSYVKFFMFGDAEEPIPDYIKISNKVGWAYGYLTDCAHIRDTKNEIEFFLAATIHVNRNRIYNDGIYEYESVGLPFLAELGRLVYQHELKKSQN